MMPSVWLQGSRPITQGSGINLQGSAPNLQGSSPNLQPAASPVGARFPGAGGNAAPTRSGGVASAGPSAAAIAQAQQAQEVAGLRNEIAARRARATSIFDALTGAVGALAAEKRAALESQFQTEQTRATEDFTDKGDELQSVYAARGLGDSSYRINAIDKAGRDYSRSIEDLGSQRQSGLAKVGGEAEGALARIRADRGSVEAINLDELGRRPDGTYDPNALRELRNSLDERIRNAEVQQSQFGTEAGFKGKLDQIAPYGGTVDALRASLTGLIQSATPKAVKDKLAGAIINNYAPGDAGTWQKFYEQESKKLQTATSVA